jgi:hypothetical protein
MAAPETWFYFDGISAFNDFLIKKFDSVPFPEELKGHSSSPFVWLERGADAEVTPLGGRDRFVDWSTQTFANDDAILAECTGPSLSDVGHNGCEWSCFCFTCCYSPGPSQTSSA